MTTVTGTSTGEDMRAAVAVANIPTLLMVLVQLTGELKWLEDPYRPGRTRGLGDNDDGGLPPEIQDEIRAAATEAILAWRAGRPAAIPQPSHDLLVRMLSWDMAEPVPDAYGPMMAAMLGIPDPGVPETEIVDPPPGFRVLVVGAGVSGIAAGVSFGRAGIDYTILERNPTVGGVWWENRYPGAGVDTPNHLYEYSFAPHDWTHFFALRDEIHAYLEKVADDFDVRRHVRFGTEAVAAEWDAAAQEWAVTVRTEGKEATLRANVLLTAVGAFNKPVVPDLPGLDTFGGPTPHTARWPADLDLTGTRVAVVGSGASSMQLVPAIAPEVAELLIFQRSPQWAAPFEKWHVPVPDPVRLLIAEVPLYHLWYRLRQAWVFNDRLHDALQRDPEWEHPERSVNPINDAHRRFFTRHITEELGERTDLHEATIPDYPPYGKRILLDNGWFKALTRDNVTLIAESVAEVRPHQVVTSAGAAFDADVLVLATGFDVVRFIVPLEVRGREGVTLHEAWDDDDARAYLGTTVPGFPNFFTMYGPNLQTGHGGSVMFMVEQQVHYVLSAVEQMFARGIGALEVRRDVHDRYNAEVDAAHESMIWTHPGMSTYYRNSKDRVVVNNPFRVVEFWAATRRLDLAQYELEPVTAPPPG